MNGSKGGVVVVEELVSAPGLNGGGCRDDPSPMMPTVDVDINPSSSIILFPSMSSRINVPSSFKPQ